MNFHLTKVIDRDIRKEVKEIIAEVVNQRVHKSGDYKLINSDIGIIAQKAGDRVLAHIVKNIDRKKSG